VVDGFSSCGERRWFDEQEVVYRLHDPQQLRGYFGGGQQIRKFDDGDSNPETPSNYRYRYSNGGVTDQSPKCCLRGRLALEVLHSQAFTRGPIQTRAKTDISSNLTVFETLLTCRLHTVLVVITDLLRDSHLMNAN
jgi:hypothetical protein